MIIKEQDELSLEQKIAQWRKEYKNIYKTVIDDEVYIWRKIKRSEYIDIHNSIFNNEEVPDDLKFWIKQEEIAKTVLLYPEDAEAAMEESAGIPTVISQDCLNRSGFGALSQQI